MNMQQQSIAFIGGGNMARSLIGGLLQGGYQPQHIRVCDPDPQQQHRIESQFGIAVADKSDRVIKGADCVVLAVKPQVLPAICSELGKSVQKSSPLFVSIAAGVRIASIARWLGKEYAIIRCMPNTPALIQAGATALYANAQTNESQRSFAESILRAVGVILWLGDEDLLDAVTALSGSGPAYLFLVVEALQNAGEKLGLEPRHSQLLAMQTVFGASKMALEANESVAELRERVTSKGGTTEQALASFYRDDLPGVFIRAMTAARDRSVELAQELDKLGD